ncbi:MAG: M48 family metallopeptidase [Desulfobacterales bacterium]|nr:M48 family metallopeptidase [Desulfobacterales bacterium]
MKSFRTCCLIFWSVLLLFSSCTTVPITGRSQLNLIPGSTILSMSSEQYGQFLKKNKKSSDKTQTEQVERVGRKIQQAVERYYTERGLAGELKNYAWEFNLMEGKEVNAWCLPGGKVVVYTGILPVAANEAGLAVIMGHEIAHAIAAHGNERMSQGMAFQFGGMALSTALATKPAETQQLWMTAFGLGAQYGLLLPYSRLHESEADHLGLIFMTMAGYDPGEAAAFWGRMAKKKDGKAPPEFLSTHPSDETRIQKIKSLIPEVKERYGTRK